LTQEDAARLLGVCEKTFRRHIDRYEDEGLEGLIDKRLNQISHRRAPVDEVVRWVDCYRKRHDGMPNTFTQSINGMAANGVTVG
jgi:transposase